VSSHQLPVFRANADDEAEALEALLTSGGEPKDLCELGRCLRVSAIASLLASADTEEFRTRLAHGVRIWRNVIEVRGVTGLVLSRCTGLFDALAVADWDAARALAVALAGLEWQPNAEYEESYLYTKVIVSRLAAGEAGAAERSSLLERYRELESDAVDWRLELLTALEARTAPEFEAALEGLMLAERDDFEYLRDKDALPEAELATLGCVSIEGIALWRLGARAGFELQDDYLFIPSLALDAAA
jgi:hypothetical protein